MSSAVDETARWCKRVRGESSRRPRNRGGDSRPKNERGHRQKSPSPSAKRGTADQVTTCAGAGRMRPSRLARRTTRTRRPESARGCPRRHTPRRCTPGSRRRTDLARRSRPKHRPQSVSITPHHRAGIHRRVINYTSRIVSRSFDWAAERCSVNVERLISSAAATSVAFASRGCSK